MQHKKKLLIIVNIFLSLAVPSCNIQSPFDATPTATSTFTPTPICPVAGTVSTPVPHQQETQLIIVLFEDGPKYREYAKTGLEILNDAFKESLEPGDTVYMLRMEADRLEDATFAQGSIKNVSLPSIPERPTKFPTLTPTPIPATPQTTVSKMAATKDAMTAVASINATATQQSFLQGCAEGVWADAYGAIDDTYREERKNVIDNFLYDFMEDEETFEDDDPVAKTAVWQGLGFASEIIENVCNEYSRCSLIIVSDMNVTYKTNPQKIAIDLAGVDVLGVMLNCKFIYSKSCKPWQTFWKNELPEVNSIDFVNSDNATEALQAFLRR